MLERFRHYALVDHRTRWRNDVISTAISIAWYLVSIAAGVRNADAVRVSIEFLIVSVTIFTVWYSVVPRTSPVIDISKRIFLPRIASVGLAVLVLAFAGFGTPALEAAILDRRLRKLLDGEPTQQQIEEAARIVSDANDHNLHASPQLISQLGAKVLNSSSKTQLQEPAVAAACVFASYRSSLSPRPEVQLSPGPVSIKLACMDTSSPAFRVDLKGLLEADTTSHDNPILSGFGGFARLEFRQCSRIMIQPQVTFPLRDVHARNITFLDGTFSYDGGPLNLESVQFIDSRFQVPPAYAGNENVRRFIAAVMTGQSITLELLAEGERWLMPSGLR